MSIKDKICQNYEIIFLTPCFLFIVAIGGIIMVVLRILFGAMAALAFMLLFSILLAVVAGIFGDIVEKEDCRK